MTTYREGLSRQAHELWAGTMPSPAPKPDPFDAYDAAEAAEWAQFPYPRPLAGRCDRCGYREDAAGHRNACQERP